MAANKDTDWDNLDLSTPESIHEFALSVEEAGRKAVAQAIARHKAVGNPIYFREPHRPDILIKELADGQGFSVDIADDGTEMVLEPLL